jgi:lycopene beta-cyclase
MSIIGRARAVGRAAPGRAEVAKSTYACMILGGGCAGLSLAWNLLERGYREPMLIVDRRERYENDRTWCFWDVEPTPFSDLATHAWRRWAVHDGGVGGEVVACCPEYPYLRLRSIDVYRRVLDRLASASNVTLALGRSIVDVDETARDVRVRTTDGEFAGLRAFSGSGPAGSPGPGPGPDPDHPPSLLQHFRGQTIRVGAPTFDPSCPMLMDFRASQDDGPHFVYLLPLSETVALVENTYLFPFAMTAERHRVEIAEYLGLRFGLMAGSYEVLEEESGAIPMTMEMAVTDRSGAAPPSPLVAASRITPIGLAGGAARPSSGYAFVRIQRQVSALAERFMEGDDPGRSSPPPCSSFVPTGVRASKYRFFDAVFLKTLTDRPDLAPRIFARMFARARPASVVRFLSERSTTIDDLRMVAALPKVPFLRASRALGDRLPSFFGE